MRSILIIEDDASIAELVRDYLEINNFTADIAADGKTGLDMALEHNYDLVIIDVMLPMLDGFSVCTELRRKREVPIIFLSARSDDIDKIRGLGLGADDYITKPFSPNELIARVKAHIARRERIVESVQNPVGGTVTVRGLTIDTNSRRVYVDGRETTFTAKEYDLLLYLAEHPGRTFTKEELFNRIWGMDSLGDISTVTVHIQRIREKIRSGSDKYIETVWGVGYRFV